MAPTARGFTAVMARRHEPPDALDYFPTPPWATRAFFHHVLPALGVEAIAACGSRRAARVTWRGHCEFARSPVLASDIYSYGYGTTPHDFLHDDPLTQAEWIITNPPFSIAREFTLRALDLANDGVAMLVRTQWIEGAGRYEKRFAIGRPRCSALCRTCADGQGALGPGRLTATAYAWFVWCERASEPARIIWIPPGCRSSLARADDRRQFAAWSLEPPRRRCSMACNLAADSCSAFPAPSVSMAAQVSGSVPKSLMAK